MPDGIMSKNRIILSCIVAGEVLLFIFLGYRVITAIRQRNNVLGEQQVTRLKKEDFIATDTGTLKYYYENGPNVVDTDTWPYLSEPAVNTTNSEGFNSTREYDISKPAGVFRIVALGDSFTYGLHVNTDDSWPNVLESMLNTRRVCAQKVSFEVLNTGVPGYDIPYEVENFRRHGGSYQPDLVIWMLLDNDFTDINELMMPVANDVYETMKKNNTLDQANDWVIPMTKAREDMMKKYTMEQLFRILDTHFYAFSSLYDGKLVMTTFSSVDTVIRQEIRSWVSGRKNSFYLDALPDINALRLTLRDGHPSKTGHQKIADSIYQYLRDNNLVPCQ
jgi:lysophospholipase L1-like esterase